VNESIAGTMRRGILASVAEDVGAFAAAAAAAVAGGGDAERLAGEDSARCRLAAFCAVRTSTSRLIDKWPCRSRKLAVGGAD